MIFTIHCICNKVKIAGPGSPPKGIQAKVDGVSVTIKWTPPVLPNGQIKVHLLLFMTLLCSTCCTIIQGYQIYYVDKDARKPLREWKAVGATDPRVVIQNLQPETKYFFRIVPYNERGSGIMSNVFTVRTEKLGAVVLKQMYGRRRQ